MKTRSVHAARLAAILAAALVISAPVVVFGQPATSTPPTVKASSTKARSKHVKAARKDELQEHLALMTERLKLTDEQREKVRPILQAHMDQARELRAQYKGKTGTPEAKAALKKAHEDLHADMDAKLAQVLTPDQMAEFKKMQAEHMAKEGKEGAKEEKEEGEK
jgi:Spy/CpxP family protein refolding chaperone